MLERSVLQHSSLGEVAELESEEIKKRGEQVRRTMESHTIESALLVLGFCFACVAVVALQAIIMVSHMTLTLQEQVAVRATPIVTRVKFGKCCYK